MKTNNININNNEKLIIEGINSIPKNYNTHDHVLKNVYFSDTIESIGDYAFWDNTSLEEVRLPQNLKHIGRACFGLSPIKNLILPAMVEIPKCAFEDCAMKKVFIPEGVKIIREYAFSGCKNLTTLILPETVELIENRAFQGCSNLKYIYLPKGVKIKDSAFYGCGKIKIEISSMDISQINYSAFGGCAIELITNGHSFTLEETNALLGRIKFETRETAEIAAHIKNETTLSQGCFGDIIGVVSKYCSPEQSYDIIGKKGELTPEKKQELKKILEDMDGCTLYEVDWPWVEKINNIIGEDNYINLGNGLLLCCNSGVRPHYNDWEVFFNH